MPTPPQSHASAPPSLNAISSEIAHFGVGDALVEEGDATDTVMILIDGTAKVSAGRHGHDLAELGPGAVIGEVSALAGGTRTATVTAVTPVTAHVLTRDQFQDLLDENPDFANRVTSDAAARIDRRHMLSFLEQLLGHLDADVIAEFEGAMKWVTVPAGERLFERGDMADAGYFLIAGRLQEWSTDLDGRTTLVREIVRDQIVGETGLIRGTPRETTVVAARDSRLVEVSLAQFMRLVNRHPAALVPVVASLARGTPTTRSTNRQRTISVCVVADVDRRVFTSRLVDAIQSLGSTQHIWAARADALLGREGISQSAHREPGDMRVAELLHEQELEHTYLVCETDRQPSEWTRRVARQADIAVAVVDATPDAAARHTVDDFFAAAAAQTKRVVVAIHPPEAERPRDTRTWAASWNPDFIVHVRRGSTSDIGRLARILAGRATSLALGGGGARGFAHIGVRRAMEELGMPIDLVAGTSIGSPLGASIAMDIPMAELTDFIAERFSGLLDYTIPVVSLVKGERITDSINQAMAGWDFEDLWRPFFCMSTNLTLAEEVVHDSGDLAWAVRASVAIPGVIPPVADGDHLLVDGGVLNNLPADVMRKRNPTGTVIGVDVAPPSGPRAKGEPALSVSGWQALRSMTSKRKNEYPGITAMLLRTMITGSVRERKRSVERGDIDLYLDLDLRGVSLLDFESVREVAAAGYEAALPRLEAWLTEQQG